MTPCTPELLPQRRLPAPLAAAYTAYAVLLFAVLALATLLAALLPGKLPRRRARVGCGARWFMRLAGLRLQLRSEQPLPTGPCVLVANHASYLDGLVMQAALPARFGFVIKREMNGVPLAGLLLRRIGAEFVDRSRGQRSALDARRVLRTASSGASLVFFPEGTFESQPGLLRFHAGAFVAAVRAASPVVPAVITGTRHVLQLDRWLIQPGTITVQLLPVLPLPDLPADEAVHWLRTQARAQILQHLPEPDLHP